MSLGGVTLPDTSGCPIGDPYVWNVEYFSVDSIALIGRIVVAVIHNHLDTRKGDCELPLAASGDAFNRLPVSDVARDVLEAFPDLDVTLAGDLHRH